MSGEKGDGFACKLRNEPNCHFVSYTPMWLVCMDLAWILQKAHEALTTAEVSVTPMAFHT